MLESGPCEGLPVMPATKKNASAATSKRMRAQAGAPAPAALEKLNPRDPRTDVKIAGDCFDRWLTELDEVELKTYLEIAHFYNVKTYHDESELEVIFGKGKRSSARLAEVLGRLEKLGLLEVMRY